jgi:hypothetical protein
LLWVERGDLDLETEAGADAWVRSRTGQVLLLPRAVLVAGEGALLNAGTDAEIQNVGDVPLEAMMVTLLGTPEERQATD